MQENLNYYEVIAKCGHVGKKNYIPIKFAVIAEDGREAAKIVRDYKRVKHHHKDAILSVTKIGFESFVEIKTNNDNDPYLKCHSRQEQNLIKDFASRIKVDNHNAKQEHSKESRKERIVHKIKKFKLIEQLAWEDQDYDYVY